ncbi:MAG: hypothetical protein GY856_02510 [bacterium]|nr:hypothetical protein [bacterium]
MSRSYAYEREPYRTELEAEVIATGEQDGRPFAVLDDTILHPESGGQPADRGRLGSVEVVDVERVGDSLRHWLEAPAGIGPARLTLDWSRRFDHMQQHTAQHLLTAIAADRFGWETTSFHIVSSICDIELDVRAISQAGLDALEKAVVDEIRADRAVTARRVAPEEMAELKVRSRGLPAGHVGKVRLVGIAGIDLNTCGGTHVQSTREIETIKLLGTEPMRGGIRLHWIAGARVRRRLAIAEARHAELRGVLGAADEELVAITELKLEQLKEALRKQRALASQLAEAVAENLANGDGPLAEAHFDDADLGFLQKVARRFRAARLTGAVLLTASGKKGAFFVVAAGDDSALDVQTAGRRVAAVLDGRGGGSGRLFQGKADSLTRRTEAVEMLAAGL